LWTWIGMIRCKSLLLSENSHINFFELIFVDLFKKPTLFFEKRINLKERTKRWFTKFVICERHELKLTSNCCVFGLFLVLYVARGFFFGCLSSVCLIGLKKDLKAGTRLGFCNELINSWKETSACWLDLEARIVNELKSGSEVWERVRVSAGDCRR
jgi:hypothetical protein